MGNILLGVGEETLKLLPVIVIICLVVYLLLRSLFGGCVPFLHKLRSECGELLGHPPLPPLEAPEAREVVASNGAPGLVQSLLGHLSDRPRAVSLTAFFCPSTHQPPSPSTAEPAAAGAPNCPVCITNWPNAALDCGHRVCAACLPEIQQRSNCCPVCRDPIRQVMRLYN
eukprot:TRINITY_DN48761_c0_g1_i1.p1 TRINITY_DN48761_c0_g1~~TRINITY_DN48761_c0_g1_i1.p1  ORF type:complete len:170 (+),score=22.81 TRINITY_DN48761_c0_g1_i1:70-579(+)